MKKTLVTFLFGLLVADFSLSANAEVYNFAGSLTRIYNDANNSTPPSALGSFNITFTTDSIADDDGANLTGISGTFLGSSITGLSSYLAPDNKLYSAASNYFSIDGVSFFVDPALGQYHSIFTNNDYPIDAVNLYFNGNDYTAVGCSTCGNIVASYSLEGAITTVTTTTAVPEPETYAMFMAGLGLLGFASRKKRNG